MALARWKKECEKPIDPETVKGVMANPPIQAGDPIGSLRTISDRSIF